MVIYLYKYIKGENTMKKVYSILITVCLFCVFSFGTSTVFAAQIDSDTVSDDGTRIVNISPNGEEDDTLSIRRVLKDSMCNKLVVNFAPGEYTLTNSLPIFDNTTFNANGAVFNQKTNGKGTAHTEKVRADTAHSKML